MTQEVAELAAPWVPSDRTFAARLAMVRHRMGWNIKEAALACGFPQATWRLWELDGTLPRRQVDVAKQIAGASGCDYLWLLLGPEGDRAVPGGDTRKYRGTRVVLPAGRAPAGGSGRARGPVAATRPLARVS